MPAALETRRLCKRFGRTVAVADLDLTIEPGEAVALLGPNGAGKTTLMRLAATLLRPTSGTIRVFGADSRNFGARARRRVGVLTHESYLYPDLNPFENLHFYARLFRVADASRRVDALLDRMGLLGWSRRPVRTLSRGLVQRCSLARVLLHEPDILFLDEPFTGLDLGAQTMLCDVLADAHRGGKTLVMSTHDLGFAFALCKSALVLVGGRLAWLGNLDPSGRAGLEEQLRAWIGGSGRGEPARASVTTAASSCSP